MPNRHLFIMPLFRHLFCFILLAVVVLTSSCAGRYFRDAGKPPTPRPVTLAEWPYQEYWTGIVFNGEKIGFSHFALSPSKKPAGSFNVRSAAALRIRLLAFDKQISLSSDDWVAADLSLKSFDYAYNLDGNRLALNGRLAGDTLEVEILTQGQSKNQTLILEDKVYPTSVINLYPVLHGLVVGRTYSYNVYDGETQTVSPVKQQILAYEESDLFQGQAFKIITRLHGRNVTTWMDSTGRPLLEMTMGGVFISNLEDKETAQQYLTQAALNKEETLLEFSRIKSNVPIPDPKGLAFMDVILSGIEHDLSLPADNRQQCTRAGEEVFCRIMSQPSHPEKESATGVPESTEKYLQPSYIIPSDIPKIRQKAEEIVATAETPPQQIQLLIEWIKKNIKQEPVDVFTALEVFENQKAECQGHALLFTTFARALGIPTRVVNGIVYSRAYEGFLYHTWCESLLYGRWVAVDPTFRQVPADATHIKLVEGERVSELLPLVDLIGKLQVRVIKLCNRTDKDPS